jgi:hypothetical protein
VAHFPAVALRLHVEEFRSEDPVRFQTLFGFPWSDDVLRSAPMTWAERAYFGPVALQSGASRPSYRAVTSEAAARREPWRFAA